MDNTTTILIIGLVTLAAGWKFLLPLLYRNPKGLLTSRVFNRRNRSVMAIVVVIVSAVVGVSLYAMAAAK